MFKKGRFSGMVKNTRARLVASCIVDEEGEKVFTVAEVEALSAKSASAIETLFKKAQEMNGMETGVEDKDVENLSEGQGEDSTSD